MYLSNQQIEQITKEFDSFLQTASEKDLIEYFKEAILDELSVPKPAYYKVNTSAIVSDVLNKSQNDFAKDVATTIDKTGFASEKQRYIIAKAFIQEGMHKSL